MGSYEYHSIIICRVAFHIKAGPQNKQISAQLACNIYVHSCARVGGIVSVFNRLLLQLSIENGDCWAPLCSLACLPGVSTTTPPLLILFLLLFRFPISVLIAWLAAHWKIYHSPEIASSAKGAGDSRRDGCTGRKFWILRCQLKNSKNCRLK